MFLLSLLTCFALSAFSAQAKVVENLDLECNRFFYKHIKPRGMDQNAKGICQKLEFDDFLYVTLYHASERIPLYSAYIFDPNSRGSGSSQSPSWKIEPQLCSLDEPDHMMTEEAYNDLDTLKQHQAINRDYEETGYDRGHLLPNSYLSGEDREATFTLTNAAPMDPCFNRIQWKDWEKYLQTFLKGILNRDKNLGTAYIVTGTVPGKDKIPQSGNRELNRVTVPSHFWTAVCYQHSYKNRKSFSFGYIGVNQPEFDIKIMSIPEMNEKLDELYERSEPSVQIFRDDCFSDNSASQKAQSQFLSLIKVPQYQRLQMSKDAQTNFFAVQNIISSGSNQGTISGITANVQFPSSSYFKLAEALKRKSDSACVLTDIKKRNMSDKRDELRKRDLSEGSEYVECQLVPEKSIDEKTAADGSSCNRFVNNDDKCTCYTQNGERKKCCSTPCLYQDQPEGYYCYSGDTQIQCSPQYSLITAQGNKCRDDHPCGTYGEDYYWCYINGNNWEFCSPPVWGTRAKDGKLCRFNHACATYSESKSKPWCYTDDDNNWKDCCISDSSFSAVNQRTCKPDHPCGLHDYTYLWCYTTDGKWDYCCKDFY